MATDLCYQVVKFSYVNGAQAAGKHAWSHIQHNDMYVLIKGDEVAGTMKMSIVAGNRTLENIDIGACVDNAISGRRNAELRGDNIRTDQLPIFGMTRDTVLALRYRQTSGITRRIQIRLQIAADCHRIVGLFQRRGMEFNDRPGTARPATSAMRPDTSNSDFRPLTAQTQTGSRFFGQDYSNSAQHQPTTEADRSMRPPSRAQPVPAEEDLYGVSPQRHDRSRPFESTMATMKRDSAESIYRMPSNGELGRQIVVRDKTIAPREVEPTRPTSKQMWRSFSTQPGRTAVYNQQALAAEPGLERPSSTSHTQNLDAIRQTLGDHDVSTSAASDLRPSSAVPQWTSGAATGQNALVSSGPSEPRPHTAVSRTSLTVPDALVQMDSNTERPGDSNSILRPGSSALSLPPLRRPSLVRENTGSSSIHQTSSRPTSAIPPIQSLPIGRESHPTPACHQTARPAGRGDGMGAGVAPSPLSDGGQGEGRTSKMDELLYRTQPLLERSVNAGVQRFTSYTDAPHEIESPPVSAHASSKTAGQPSSAAAHSSTVDLHGHGTVSTNLNTTADPSLNAYATQSREDRDATLESFMLANLDNPAFKILCEDVENCWQRITIGQ